MKKSGFTTKYGFIAAISAVVIIVLISLFVFTEANGNRIKRVNREYLEDSTRQLAANVDSAISDGYDNIKIVASLIEKSLDEPYVDISMLQDLIADSVFDFMEFADSEGMDHNITGGVSDARDRKYYLDAMEGNSGMELIFNSRATHETLLMFYHPVYFEGEVIGSIIGTYQASKRITELLTVDYFGERADSYLLNEAGRIIATNRDIDTNSQELFIWTALSVGIGEETEMRRAVLKGTHHDFTLPGNETGGCMVSLPESGWTLVQVFPEKASTDMMHEANSMVYVLVGGILAIYAVVITGVILFYRSQRKKVEEANMSKTNFLFNMSHDIRTPMNAITGYTAMAKKHIDDRESVSDYLDKIEVSGKQLLKLVNQVLDMSRIESGKVVIDREPMDLADFHSEMMTIAEVSATGKDINLTGSADVVNRVVFADKTRLSQLVINVLGNAVKYTPEGGSITFDITEIPGQNEYVFKVADTGIGMSKEFLSRIYEPFSREKSSTVSGIEGTGLGMSIVKKITDMMGGKLDIKSEEGKGTTVTMTLGLMQYRGPLDEQTVRMPVAGAFTGKRVLLVEDNEMNREIASDILSDEGIEIETAEDGDIAVSMVAEHDPSYYSFVLMDIQMPRMNGYDATREIRSMDGGKYKDLVIIAMTANAFEEDRQNAMDAGMNDHLAKPIDIKKLLLTMAKYI